MEVLEFIMLRTRLSEYCFYPCVVWKYQYNSVAEKSELLIIIIFVIIAIVDDRTISVAIIMMLQLHLSGLVRSCLLLGNRSVAHKASKIIVTALE